MLCVALACWSGQPVSAQAPATETTNRAALRIATAIDPQTMDPHAIALLYHSRVVFQIYESLVGRD